MGAMTLVIVIKICRRFLLLIDMMHDDDTNVFKNCHNSSMLFAPSGISIQAIFSNVEIERR